MEAELTVAFLAFTERYTSRVTCVPYESVKVRFPFSIFGKASLSSNPILIDCFFGLGCRCGVGHGYCRLSRNRLRLCSRASRRRGVFILLHQRTRVTIILLVPRCHRDCSRWRRKMSARQSFRSPSHSHLRTRFTPQSLMPFLGGCPG
jgi:hypothetical protein